jgi:hypothetical protein
MFSSSISFTEKIGVLLGGLGALSGFALWGLFHWNGYLFWGMIPFPLNPNPIEGERITQIQLNRIFYYIFIFVPACLALTSVLFKKKYLMFFVIFLHLPIGDFISGDYFFMVQLTFFFYLFSAILMTVQRKNKNNKHNEFR